MASFKFSRGFLKKLRGWHPTVRNTAGILLVIFGLMGFLPILGFWMIPLGLLLLSVDFRWAKRAYAWVVVMFRRIRNKLRGQAG